VKDFNKPPGLVYLVVDVVRAVVELPELAALGNHYTDVGEGLEDLNVLNQRLAQPRGGVWIVIRNVFNDRAEVV